MGNLSGTRLAIGVMLLDIHQNHKLTHAAVSPLSLFPHMCELCAEVVLNLLLSNAGKRLIKFACQPAAMHQDSTHTSLGSPSNSSSTKPNQQPEFSPKVIPYYVKEC